MLLLAACVNFPPRLLELCRLQLLDSQQLLILVLIKCVALNCLLLTSPAQSSAGFRGDHALVCVLRRWLTRVLSTCCACGRREMSSGRWGTGCLPAPSYSKEKLQMLFDLHRNTSGLSQNDGERGLISKVPELSERCCHWGLPFSPTGPSPI